jgi:hypothetical protein
MRSFSLNRIFAACFAITTVGFAASTAFAAGSLVGYQRVTMIQIGVSGFMTVTFDASLATYTCTPANDTMITFDGTTALGEERRALFTAALLSGKKVRVSGTGVCSSGVELLSWVALK